MAMVGSILGLGDRHLENILLDSKTGDAVHVDFNCLFWKGLTFEKPEKVPFRLTRNIVDAMGVMGYEGVFRRVCEIALRVLRANREALLSVLETFIYDPLIEKKGHGEADVKTINKISNALQGIVDSKSLQVSVEGQVHQLIEEASSLENLAEVIF